MDKVNRTKDASDLIRSCGLRATPIRILLLEKLSTAVKPLNVQSLRQLLPKADQASLYRNLHALKTAGLIQQIDFQHGHAHYIGVRGRAQHFAICTECGRVADISECEFPNMEKRVLQQSGFASIHQHNLEFYGLCKTCAKKINAAGG